MENLSINDMVAAAFLLVSIMDIIVVKWVLPQAFKKQNIKPEEGNTIVMALKGFIVLAFFAALFIYFIRPF